MFKTMRAETFSMFVFLAFQGHLIGGLAYSCLSPSSCTCYGVEPEPGDSQILTDIEGIAGFQAECHCNDARANIPAEFSDYHTLEIKYRRRAVLTNETFRNTTFSSVRSLILSNVEFIEPGAFAGFEKVTKLFLKECLINVLHKDMFMHLEGLQELCASDGEIYVIKDGAFLGLNKLTTLSLNNNSIWNIQKDSLLGLQSLSMLSLSHNNILDLRAHTFLNTPKLGDIELQNNKIRSVECNTFADLSCPDNIHLEDNQIQLLPEPRIGMCQDNTWHHFNVYLQGNPLRCDCHMQWVKLWDDNAMLTVHGTCALPNNTTLQSFYKSDEEQCNTNGSEIEIRKGGVSELTCPIEDATWITPTGMEIQGHGERLNDCVVTAGDSLIIFNTQQQHEGKYVCRSPDGSRVMVYTLAVKTDITINELIAISFGAIVVMCIVLFIGVNYTRRCVQRDRTLVQTNRDDDDSEDHEGSSDDREPLQPNEHPGGL